MNDRILFLPAALLPATGSGGRAQEVMARRGLWATDGSAQNSLAALAKGDYIGCYGSAFDVQLTADHRLAKTRLILEQKPHATPRQESRAMEEIVRMMEGFSQHAAKGGIRQVPKGTPVHLPGGGIAPWGWSSSTPTSR